MKAVPGLSFAFQDASLIDFELDRDLDVSFELDTYQLSNAIGPVKTSFDFIVIDCPPGLGDLVTNALAAADEVLVPIDLRTVDSLSGFISLVRNMSSHTAGIAGADIFLVGNMFQKPRVGAWNDEQDIAEHLSKFACPVAETSVHRRSAFPKAHNRGQPLMVSRHPLTEGGRKARNDIRAVAREIVSGDLLGCSASSLGKAIEKKRLTTAPL